LVIGQAEALAARNVPKIDRVKWPSEFEAPISKPSTLVVSGSIDSMI
jgi:hypothetical protein